MMTKIKQRRAAKRLANAMPGIYAWRPGRPPS